MTTQTMSRIGWTMSGLFAAFMIGASVAPKLLQLPVAEETLAQLGWRHGYAILIGVIELTCTVLFLVPRTAVLGAVLMMGLLGGAIATQLRAGTPMFSHILFGVYLGLFMWGALWLRNPQLRALLPVRRG